MVGRLLKYPKNQSFFLFGARGTGKSTWLREQFPPGPQVLWFDLLDLELEDLFRTQPSAFAQRLGRRPATTRWVVVDEIQKLPRLLDSVHESIESDGLKFALSGSSARKLKAGGANLLAGRALNRALFPLTHLEWGDSFALDSALRWGTLPFLLTLKTDEERADYLRAYSQTYLKEEVWGEQLVRKLDPFRKFLEVSAQSQGKIINHANIARDVGVDDKTVKSYFEILEDTLLGTHLEPFSASFRKRLAQKPKFYFFDPGVARALSRTLTLPLVPRTSPYGEAFEHFVVLEALRLHAYRPRDFRFSYLRTQNDAEVDLVIERPGQATLFVEIKSTQEPNEVSLGALRRLASSYGDAQPICLCQTSTPRKVGEVDVLPWDSGLREIFA